MKKQGTATTGSHMLVEATIRAATATSEELDLSKA